MEKRELILDTFLYKIKLKDRILFYEHLANMLEWGITIIVALRSFIEKTPNPKLKEEIGNLLFFIDSWDSVNLAMKKMPKMFSKREIAIVESGENSWSLQRSFLNISIDLRKQEELITKAKWSLTYPFIILCFLTLAVLVVMYYVIPQFKTLFESLDSELPFVTKTLVMTSDFVIWNIGFLIFLVIGLVIWFKFFVASDFWKMYIDDLKLKLPLVWKVYKNYMVANIASSMSLLLAAWIDIIKSFRLTADWLTNELYKWILLEITDRVASGKKVSESIEEIDPNHYFFWTDFIQMINAWEKTSTLNKTCEKLATQYSREVDSSLGILMKWIEPLAILIAAMFVFWFAIAIMSVVMQMSNLNF